LINVVAFVFESITRIFGKLHGEVSIFHPQVKAVQGTQST
jgi:hypothetical protein